LIRELPDNTGAKSDNAKTIIAKIIEDLSARDCVSDSIAWYDAHAADLSSRYEAIDPAKLHSWLLGLVPTKPGAVLDIGAGSGRDAAWFARQGHDVIAVEPSGKMREEAQRFHPDPRVCWMDERLPELSEVGCLGISFDLVMLTAVWQHVAPSDRERAFRKVARLVKSGGLLAITLRLGPAPADRRMHPVSVDEVERLARNHGFEVEKIHHAPDEQGRTDVQWTCIALRLPDDGTGALPLLRHVILIDQKSATYKLGLLRALCRTADGSSGMVRDTGGEFVRVPLGLVALNWLRLYLPLIREDLPQTPTNIGPEGLGFAKTGFEKLLSDGSANDLRIGARLSQERAKSLHAALKDCARTIDRMPSTYMTYPNGGRILPVERQRVGLAPDVVELDSEYLEAFGWMIVPTHMWRSMRQNASWIEPALVNEWARLIREYARRQGRNVVEEKMITAMRWSDPERDVLQVRKIAVGILDSGDLHCAWTDRPLSPSTLDVDHMFPWAAWPCSDLWNLLPTHREVNQRLKRDRLPSAAALSRAEDRIIDWWQRAYLANTDTRLSDQFLQEARASLPTFSTAGPTDVFASVTLQRIRLRHDQQVPEWEGEV
jgi:SAM-dependent methyltransferase